MDLWRLNFTDSYFVQLGVDVNDHTKPVYLEVDTPGSATIAEITGWSIAPADSLFQRPQGC